MSNVKNLILVGGGGHCKAVIDVAKDAKYSIQGILEHPSCDCEDVLGFPIIGVDDDIPKYVNNSAFIITVGQIKNPTLRIKLDTLVKNVGGNLATIIATTAHVSDYALIGEGTVVLHYATINADAHIGRNCIINTHSNIEHDVKIGDFCHISTGAMVNGNCQIGKRVFIGSGAIIANGVTICDDCVIGAGAVVTKSITEKGIYVGNPAKIKV